MRYVIIPGLLLAASTPALSQSDQGAPTVGAAEAQAGLRALNGSADNDPRTGFLGSGVEVSAGSDASNVSLTLAHSWDNRVPGSNLNFTAASLVLTTPISDKERKEGAFVTDGGLPNSYSAQISVTRAWIRDTRVQSPIERRLEINNAAVAACRAARRTTPAKEACDRMNTDELHEGRFMSDTDFHTSMSGYATQNLWLTGLSGAIGTREFSFRRLSDFMEEKVQRTEYSFSIYGGVAPRSSAFYLGAGYEYRRQYKNVPARTLCPPPAAGAPLECFAASYGEPARNIDSNVFALARWQGGVRLFGSNLPLGIEVRGTYDTRDNVFGVAVPIYFLSGSDGLRGGVRFNWQDVDNRDERYGVRVFVGTPFHLLGG